MTTALDLINAIESGKTLECEQVFADLVQSKVEAAIAARADEVRAGMFESAQLDELSKGTLGSYVKKASASGMKDAGNAGAYSQKSSLAAKDGDVKKSDDAAERFAKYDKSATKRKEGIGKAVTRLTKESAELEEGAKYVTFSGKDSSKNPVNVHVGTDAQGNKYHVISGNPGTNHHASKVFLGSNDAAEKKMKSVADMVHAGKHDEALAHLNKTSHIKFSKAG
jgi:hypothetical protein